MARQQDLRSPVRRYKADDYLLKSLVAFGSTVVLTRTFLQLAGFPQIGTSLLHIAHAIWGGLLLFIAVLLPLAISNRWALTASAYLSGIGFGLFIDEVGKFITQANDYFFAPAMSLIYGFFLLNAFVYSYFRRTKQNDPRHAMYHALDGLRELLDGDLDSSEALRIHEQLTIAQGSDREDVVSLANAINAVMRREKMRWPPAKPDLAKRFSMGVDNVGLRLGRSWHKAIISVITVSWLLFVIAFLAVLALEVPSVDYQVAQWRGLLIGIQVMVGSFMLLAVSSWLMGKEERGIQYAIYGFLFSLVALQTAYFYLAQFAAITFTLLQLLILQVLFMYRRWYLATPKL
jgi:hypothetical protein